MLDGAKAHGFSLAILKPAKRNVWKEDLVNAIFERHFKIHIKGNGAGRSPCNMKANRAWAGENVSLENAQFLKSTSIFVHFELFVWALPFKRRTQGNIDHDYASPT